MRRGPLVIYWGANHWVTAPSVHRNLANRCPERPQSCRARALRSSYTAVMLVIGGARRLRLIRPIEPGTMSNTDSEQLAYEFFRRVWAPPHDLAAIDELMTEDYRITTAGAVISGREAFKAWVAGMQSMVGEATNEHLEVFTNAAGDRVVSRWMTRGFNNGMFGLPADGRRIAFSGIAIWRVEDGRLAECWIERSALELYNELRSAEP
jgi:predicted ester cyclase